MLNKAVFAPMPSAGVSSAATAKPGFFSNWRKTNLRSFITQCLHRIDFSRSASGQPAGQQRDSKHEHRNGGERQWISGAHAVKETSHDTRQGESTGQASDQACE